MLIPFSIRYALESTLGSQAAYILFVPAMMIAAWYGGVGPAFLTVAGSLLLINYFFTAPAYQWTPLDWYQITVAATYIFCALVVIAFVGALRRERQRVATNARQSQERAEMLQQEVEARKRITESLRASEQKFRVLAQTAVDAVISADSSAKITLFNRAAEQMFGYTAAEILGRSLTLLMPERFRALCSNGMKRFLATGEAHFIGRTVELIGLKEDGTEFPLEMALSAWETSEGKFFTAMLHDITQRKRAEETLRRSEELLRMTTEGGRIGLWSWDIVNDTVEWNTVEYEQCGLTPGGTLKLETFIHCIHPDDRAFVGTEIIRCLREGHELNLEHRIVRPDGSVRWNQCKGRATYAEGRPVRMSGIAMDITERKEARERLKQSEQRLRLATEFTGIGLWDWDLEKDILDWTEITRRHLGLPNNSEKRYERAIECVHPDDRATADRTVQNSIQTGAAFDLQCRIVWRDSSLHWVWAKGHPIVDESGRTVRIIGILMEITDRKTAEAALQEAKDALARHAEELERAVARRTAELQASLQDMESFCYTIAHDLRAPLRAMSGFSEALEQDYAETLDALGREYCARIYRSAQHMNQLISDLLAYGRLAHTSLPVTAVDLAQEIEKVLQRTAPQIEERHARVDVDKPLPKVYGDALVLDQVLENLITNAVKFVPPNREPHVHIYAEHYHDHVRLCIEDNGIGIEAEHRGRIFRPFERLHTVEAYPGTGIGLAIVQRGIEKMGGHVGVEAARNQGSRFWVELPEYH